MVGPLKAFLRPFVVGGPLRPTWVYRVFTEFLEVLLLLLLLRGGGGAVGRFDL